MTLRMRCCGSTTRSQAVSAASETKEGAGRSLRRKSSQGKMTNPAAAVIPAAARCP
jgi:hypothetical protein